MRQSQIAVLSALGLAVLGMILAAGLARVALSQLDSGAGSDQRRGALAAQTTRNLELEGFRSVEVHGQWTVTLTQGPQWQVELSYPENLELGVRVESDRLVLDYASRGWTWRGGDDERMTARIVMPELADIDISGASTLELAGFDGERLAIRVSGAAQVEGRDARYDELLLSVSGAGEVDLRAVPVTDSRVDLSGAGDITLAMNGGALSGSISGARNVRYYGPVSEQRVSISGFGSVNRAD